MQLTLSLQAPIAQLIAFQTALMVDTPQLPVRLRLSFQQDPTQPLTPARLTLMGSDAHCLAVAHTCMQLALSAEITCSVISAELQVGAPGMERPLVEAASSGRETPPSFVLPLTDETLVKNLVLPARILSKLASHRLSTLGQLRQLPTSWFLSLPGIGIGTVESLQLALEHYGIFLPTSWEAVRPQPVTPDNSDRAQEWHWWPVGILELNDNTAHMLFRHQIVSVGDLVARSRPSLESMFKSYAWMFVELEEVLCRYGLALALPEL